MMMNVDFPEDELRRLLDVCTRFQCDLLLGRSVDWQDLACAQKALTQKLPESFFTAVSEAD